MADKKATHVYEIVVYDRALSEYHFSTYLVRADTLAEAERLALKRASTAAEKPFVKRATALGALINP